MKNKKEKTFTLTMNEGKTKVLNMMTMLCSKSLENETPEADYFVHYIKEKGLVKDFKELMREMSMHANKNNWL